MTDAPQRAGAGLFLSSVLGFALCDLAFLAAPKLPPSLPMARVAPALAFALLGAFALSLAFVAVIVLGAVRSRRMPATSDLFRASTTLLLTLLHAALLVAVARR